MPVILHSKHLRNAFILRQIKLVRPYLSNTFLSSNQKEMIYYKQLVNHILVQSKKTNAEFLIEGTNCEGMGDIGPSDILEGDIKACQTSEERNFLFERLFPLC